VWGLGGAFRLPRCMLLVPLAREDKMIYSRQATSTSKIGPLLREVDLVFGLC